MTVRTDRWMNGGIEGYEDKWKNGWMNSRMAELINVKLMNGIMGV